MKQDLNLGGGMSVVTFPRVIYIVSEPREAAGGLGTHCNHLQWGTEVSQHQE